MTCNAAESRIDVFSLVVWQGQMKLNEDLHMCRCGQKRISTQTSLLKIHIVLLRKLSAFSKNHRKLEGATKEGGKEGERERQKPLNQLWERNNGEVCN